MTDDLAGPESAEPDDDYIAWRESVAQRLRRRASATAAGQDGEPAPEPFRSPGWRVPAGPKEAAGRNHAGPSEAARSSTAFGAWSVAAARALLDVQFRRPAPRTLLPLAYLLGLAFAVAVPIVLTVLLWRVSMALGIVFGVVVAVPLGLTIAAAVRLALEFLVNAARLAGRVEHIAELADDLFQALSDVAEPVNQLSEDVRAVQFWRFRRRPARK